MAKVARIRVGSLYDSSSGPTAMLAQKVVQILHWASAEAALEAYRTSSMASVAVRNYTGNYVGGKGPHLPWQCMGGVCVKVVKKLGFSEMGIA